MFNIADNITGIKSYGQDIIRNLKVTEMSLLQKEEEVGKLEAKMVFDTRVTESVYSSVPPSCHIYSAHLFSTRVVQVCSMTAQVCTGDAPLSLLTCK